MGLFKYTGLNYISSCIENGIYASCLDKINDPFEGKGIRYKNDFRVVCLTSSPYQMLMWAYYVNHQGCCIEFDVSKINGIRKVEYIKEFQNHEDMSTDQIIESLYKKGNEWSHEKEFRLVYHKSISDRDFWVINKGNIFLKAPVKKITFGYAAEVDDKYPEVVRYIYDYNKSHKQKIEVSKCKLMQNKYQLEADKQYNLESEIAEFQSDKKSVILSSSGPIPLGDHVSRYSPQVISVESFSAKPIIKSLKGDSKK